MKFSLKQFIVPNFAKRLAFMLPGVLLMGVFVSILVEIGWGTDPASFMNLNIASLLGWGLGNTEVLVYGLMLVFTFAFGAEMIGFGTLANGVIAGKLGEAGIQGSIIGSVAMSFLLGPVITVVGKPLKKIL